jgi:hypothetical protein
MPQHDLDLANDNGAAMRADMNGAIKALGSTMKGPTAPPAPVAGMLWLDDNSPTATEWTLFMYDGVEWIVLGTLNTTTNRFTAASSTIGAALLFAADAAAARTAIGSPPTPNTGAGVGRRETIGAALGSALVLPASGSWDYFAVQFNSTGNITSYASGVAAGGTTVQAALASHGWGGTAWRIS